VSVRGTTLRLEPVEAALLRQLIEAAGRARTKDELALGLRPRVRSDAADADEVRAVERSVESLRRALAHAGADARIESELGTGYRLRSA